MEDVKDWHINCNASQMQHAIDPNRLFDLASIIIAEKAWDQLNEVEKDIIVRGYIFRHEEADFTDLGYYPLSSAKLWWNIFNPSQRQHVLDPHQLFEWSSVIILNDYGELDGEQKKIVDKVYHIRLGEVEEGESYAKTHTAEEGGKGSGITGHLPYQRVMETELDPCPTCGAITPTKNGKCMFCNQEKDF